MPEFVAEPYPPRTDAAAAGRSAALAERTAELVRTFFVPEVETCHVLRTTPSASSVRAAGDGAGLTFERIAEAVTAQTQEGR